MFHQDGDDLAVCELDISSAIYKFKFLPLNWFLTKEVIDEHSIGPGDDVFMVGRFVDHAGHQHNTHRVRFGHISMMPGEPIYNRERGMYQISFLIEMFSHGGFSGSPVFVHIPPGSQRPHEGITAYREVPWLLGVSRGHFRTYEQVLLND